MADGGRLCSTLVVAIALVACAPAGGDLRPLPPLEPRPYTLDAGDTVRVVVFGNAELSAEYPIDGSGAISFPLIGQVSARGLARAELEEQLRRRLGDSILVNPSVSVQIVGFRPFYILGEVQKPGQFPYVTDMTVLAAVAIAGGYTYRAEKEYVRIIRKVGADALDGSAEPNSFVAPGDVIFVFERWF